MKAGKTELETGTQVRITGIAGNDADDRKMVGLVGEITHPFVGLMHGPASDYVAGVYITDENAKEQGLVVDTDGIARMNLCRGDTFEVYEPENEPSAPGIR